MIVLMVVVGAVFVYAAVKGEDPRAILQRGLKRN